MFCLEGEVKLLLDKYFYLAKEIYYIKVISFCIKLEVFERYRNLRRGRCESPLKKSILYLKRLGTNFI